MTYETIEVRPISGALGAEIRGVDLTQPLGNQTFHEIHDALMANLVIFFRDQDLTPEQHKAFAACFGPPQTDVFVRGMDADPEILEVVKRAEDA